MLLHCLLWVLLNLLSSSTNSILVNLHGTPQIINLSLQGNALYVYYFPIKNGLAVGSNNIL